MVTLIKKQTTVRVARPDDSKKMAAEWYAAFNGVSLAHGAAPEFDSVEEVERLVDSFLTEPNAYAAVAEEGDRVLGGAFLWEGETVAGIGPVFVSPVTQESGVGRRLMGALMDRADSIGQESVRLTQLAYNRTSLALYAKLGFRVTEPLAIMSNPPQGLRFPGYSVRTALMEDLFAMDHICHNIHMHSRHGEIRYAIGQGAARIVFKGSEMMGYSSDVGFLGHSAAYTNEALYALIASVEEFSRGSISIPMRNAELFQWCLNNGMQVKFPCTLMVRGWYEQPEGPFLPSCLF